MSTMTLIPSFLSIQPKNFFADKRNVMHAYGMPEVLFPGISIWKMSAKKPRTQTKGVLQPGVRKPSPQFGEKSIESVYSQS